MLIARSHNDPENKKSIGSIEEARKELLDQLWDRSGSESNFEL